MYNQVSKYWADYVSSEEWNLTATIRPFKYKLSETNAFDLASRLMKYKDIIKVFYALENDNTGHNHMHLLLDTQFLVDYLKMKEVRWELNSMLGMKYNSGMVQYVDTIRTNVGICKYVTKHIGGNNVYNLLS